MPASAKKLSASFAAAEAIKKSIETIEEEIDCLDDEEYLDALQAIVHWCRQTADKRLDEFG